MYFPNGLPAVQTLSKAKLNALDNYDTYNTFDEIGGIDLSNAIEDRLYFAKTENKYYRFNKTLQTFELAIDFTSINTTIQQLNTDVTILDIRVDAMDVLAGNYATKTFVENQVLPEPNTIPPSYLSVKYGSAGGMSTVPTIDNYNALKSSIDSKNGLQDAKIIAIETELPLKASITFVENRVIPEANTVPPTYLSISYGSVGGMSTVPTYDEYGAFKADHESRVDLLEGDKLTQDNRLSALELIDFQHGNAIADLENRADNIEGLNAGQQSRLSAIEFANVTQGNAIFTLEGRTTTLETDMTNKILPEPIVAVPTYLVCKYSTTETASVPTITKFNSEIARIDGENFNQSSRMDGIDASINANGLRLTSIEGINTTQDGRLTNVENLNGAQTTDIGNLQGRCATIEGVDIAQNTAISALQTSVTNITAVNDTQTNNIASIVTVNTTQTNDIATLQTTKQNNLFTTPLYNAPGKLYGYQLKVKNIFGTWFPIAMSGTTQTQFYVVGDLVTVSVKFIA